MEGRLVIKDCAVYRADGRVRPGMAVVIEGRFISRVALDAEVPALPGDWVVDAKGRLLAPGLTDAHTRLVNASLVDATASELLESEEARAERRRGLAGALRPNEVAALTAWSLARGLRRGVTCYVELLHAPGCVEDGLLAQAEVARRLGARLVNAHEARDEPGAVEANEKYVASVAHDARVRGAIGIACASQASDDVLARAGRAMQALTCGAHFRVGESEADVLLTWQRFGQRPLARLESAGLLGPKSVAAFARAIDRTEAAALTRSATLVALAPQSSQLREGPGAPGSEVMPNVETRLGIGSDGELTVWEAWASALTLVVALARQGKLLDPDAVLACMVSHGPSQFIASLFGVRCGAIDEGAVADLALFDLVVRDSTISMQRLAETSVSWTIVDGRVVVREGLLVGVDAATLSREAGEAAQAVRQRWKEA